MTRREFWIPDQVGNDNVLLWQHTNSPLWNLADIGNLFGYIPRMSRLQSIVGLAVWIGICFVPGIVGSRFLPGPWYASLAKPSWTPPGYIFGPVWSLLYASMGVAAWLLWRRAGLSGAKTAFVLFAIQLILNALWSWFFFGMQRPGLALVDIVVLWIFILASMIAFWRLYTPSGAILVPYFAWVTFATALNLAIWNMNRVS
jgi:benzodiazapine receptor